jgi:NADH-quinone oxidoreductase subunit A
LKSADFSSLTISVSGLSLKNIYRKIRRQADVSILNQLYPFIIYTALTAVIVAALLAAAALLGSGGTSRNKALPYESGIVPSGSARLATTVPFYLIAIFFIVFDVESAFIFTWAVAWKELGFVGLLHITYFIVALLAGLVWIWIKGGLEWGRKP